MPVPGASTRQSEPCSSVAPASQPTRTISPRNATPSGPSGVDEYNIHVDHGLTGTKRVQPGLREAISGSFGDTLVVAKLDRLARFPA
jgi:hypothetical protein